MRKTTLSNETLPISFVLGIIYAFASWIVPLMKVPFLGNVNLFSSGVNHSNPISILYIVIFSYLSFLLFEKRVRDSFYVSLYIFISSATILLYYKVHISKFQSSLNDISDSIDSGLLSGIMQGVSSWAGSLFSIAWGAVFLPAGAFFLTITLYQRLQNDDRAYRITYLILLTSTLFTLYFFYNNNYKNYGSSNKKSADIPTLKSTDPTSKIPKQKITKPAVKTLFHEAYKKNIQIYNVEANYRESILKGKVPGVSFKMRNLGKKNVDDLKVTVKFLNAANQAISEETFYPLSRSDPLKPGFIWRLERGKFYVAENIPSEWASGKVKIEISNIKVSGVTKNEYFDKKTQQEHLNYIKNHIMIYDISARYRNSLLDGKLPGVVFKIKNNGTRTISDISVMFQFLDSRGQAIHEVITSPVRSKSLRGNSYSLKPNYIWQNKKSEFFAAPSVPEEWQEGSVKTKVVALNFEETSP